MSRVKPIELKLRYVGPRRVDLINGKIYQCTGIWVEAEFYRVIDEEDEEYCFPMKWFEIVDNVI